MSLCDKKYQNNYYSIINNLYTRMNSIVTRLVLRHNSQKSSFLNPKFQKREKDSLSHVKEREENILLMISSVKIFILLFFFFPKKVLREKKNYLQPSRCNLYKRVSTPIKLRSFWSDRGLVWISIKDGCLCNFKGPSEGIHDHRFTV